LRVRDWRAAVNVTLHVTLKCEVGSGGSCDVHLCSLF
jgi:hypothetical protein